MADITTKTIKISTIKLNSDNPRTITEKQMERLIKSLSSFQDMMKIREIIVDENLLCLGGTMRLLALQKMGTKTCKVKIIKGLTPDQKREFIIKDNSQFGEWDMEKLESEWGTEPLEQWGVNMPEKYDPMIPDDNENIDEKSFSNTKHECQICGFKW